MIAMRGGGRVPEARAVVSRNKRITTVMPLGDSITQGGGTLGGWRSKLFANAVADGKLVDFVGVTATGPTTVSGVPCSNAHCGWPGSAPCGCALPSNSGLAVDV